MGETGHRLRRFRQLCGLTQIQMAHLIGVPQPTISAIENGKVNPTVRTLKRLARGLGAELHIELVRGDSRSGLLFASEAGQNTHGAEATKAKGRSRRLSKGSTAELRVSDALGRPKRSPTP
jgi:transcriptional regulator with XRE-family HTH domain